MADKSATKWLVERARQSLLNKDPFEAKTWLITAKTLYPGDFSILYEAYVIEQNARKVEESAKMFFEMFEKFPEKSLIWDEVIHITEALEGFDLDPHQEFLKEMFSCLPQTAQREILLKAAGQCRDCIEKCRMMLLLMRHFPDVIPKNGVALTEMLTDAEDSEYKRRAINPYRKLLVCDVLPHLLASEGLTIIEDPENQFSEETPPGITQGQVYRWLELALQFYISCATSPPSTQDPQLLSPGTGQTVLNYDRDIITSVQDGKGPWAKLYDLFCLTANKCGWSQTTRILDKLDILAHRNSKVRWACLAELHHKLKKAGKQNSLEGCQMEPVEKGGVFYATLMLFLQTVWEYCKAVNRMDSNTFAGSSYPLVLLEHIGSEKQSTSPEDSPVPKKKKKKLAMTGPGSPSKDDKNKNSPSIFIAKSCGVVSPSLADDFVVSVDAWHLLNTHSNYKTEFTRLLTEWHVSDWTWMDSFKVDRLVYKNKYKKVIEFLKEHKEFLEMDASANPGPLIRATLQLSCCSFCLGEHKTACTEALDALEYFCSHSSPAQAADVRSPLRRSSSVIPTPHAAARELATDKPTVAGIGSAGQRFRLIQCSEVEVLTFCVHLLVTSLKKILATEVRNDTLLGHVIVMLQYDWPKEEHTFLELMKIIRDQGSFKYTCFFDYVVVIDILEEFAYLYSEGNVKMDLMQSVPTGPRSRGTVTRGVNKGVKEDFRAAMERQVSRADESVEALVRTFFLEERDTLLP